MSPVTGGSCGSGPRPIRDTDLAQVNTRFRERHTVQAAVPG